MVHCWKETNMPILSRKGRSQKNVPDSMGEATYDVWTVIRLATLASVLAASHIGTSTGNQLDTRT